MALNYCKLGPIDNLFHFHTCHKLIALRLTVNYFAKENGLAPFDFDQATRRQILRAVQSDPIGGEVLQSACEGFV